MLHGPVGRLATDYRPARLLDATVLPDGTLTALPSVHGRAYQCTDWCHGDLCRGLTGSQDLGRTWPRFRTRLGCPGALVGLPGVVGRLTCDCRLVAAHPAYRPRVLPQWPAHASPRA